MSAIMSRLGSTNPFQHLVRSKQTRGHGQAGFAIQNVDTHRELGSKYLLLLTYAFATQNDMQAYFHFSVTCKNDSNIKFYCANNLCLPYTL